MMGLGRFSTGRRLALLALFTFFATLWILHRTQLANGIPKPNPHSPHPPQQPPGAGTRHPPASHDKFHDDDDEDVRHTAPHPGDRVYGNNEERKPTSIMIPSLESPMPHRIYPPPLAPLNKEALHQYVMQEKDNWARPPEDGMHFPGYGQYAFEDYDPNRWEGMDPIKEYYTHNGLKALITRKPQSPKPYLPYPEYNTRDWHSQWKGEYVPCLGPRNELLNESLDEHAFAFRGLWDQGFPRADVNNEEILHINTDICYDRYGRYGAYGLGEDEEHVNNWRKPKKAIDWDTLHWGVLQDACLARNAERYSVISRKATDLSSPWELPSDVDTFEPLEDRPSTPRAAKFKSRTAVLLRTWEGYKYSSNDLEALRAMVTELSLLSGGEYQLFFLVNVKQENADIYNDPEIREQILKDTVPPEFQDTAILWTEKVMQSWYPLVGDWQVYWHQFMVLQWFSKTHPEFEYVWNWENDARYTGQHYHFLEQVATFARNAPRKHLWERNSRLYFPSAHGTYEQFIRDTDASINRAAGTGIIRPVWGPRSYEWSTQEPVGPKPPHAQDHDKYSWGVGEEADLITLQPIWDPINTDWSMKEKIWNYVPGRAPEFTEEDPIAFWFTDPGFKELPRRAFINTVVRMSRRLLHAMHLENRAGRTMQAELFPATVALHHGLKAVYAPHPIWLDRKWPPRYLDAVLNAQAGMEAQWSQQFDSPYNHDREVNFKSFSWYYAADFARVLYRRWLGWYAWDQGFGTFGGKQQEDLYGRMCLPGMLLHPVKNVREDAGP